MMTISPGCKVGANICSTQARKHSPFIGPSSNIGATKPVSVKAADEGNGLPVTVRDCGAATFAFRRPAAEPRHLCRKPAFIDEDQAFRGKIALTASPALPRRPHIGAFLLAGMWGLFLCVRP